MLERLLEPETPIQLNNEKECQITRRDDLLEKEATDWAWPNKVIKEREKGSNF